MMPYVALAIFPVITFLFPNPVEIWWLFKAKGPKPIPPEIMKKHMGIGLRLQGMATNVLIAGLLLLLMLRYSIPAGAVGLSFDHWEMDILIGCAAGGCNVAFKLWLAHKSRAASRARISAHMSQASEPLLFWVPALILWVFVEEFWRGFCLNAFKSTGYSMAIAVVLTSLVFGVAHFGLRPGGIAAKAFIGAVFALLFVWRWSVIPPYLVHLISNLDSLQAGRRARSDATVAPI
ncbi:MAG: CPBP family intramembrane metalloprotease [Acidobacteriota bacterium]